ncbi:MAG: cellulase family glycosylhydrolase [Lachnospiraceae bacterium]|nr:cellulase family glycosylhydrolase [Lachnospiraceae bacterium]
MRILRRNGMRRVAVILGMILLLTCMLGSVAQAAAAGGGAQVIAKSAMAAETGEELTGKTAAEVVNLMGIGWNIGNTFDATGGTGAAHETNWGNPKVTKELIHTVSEAGFNVIRIPITWAQELNLADNYKIKDEFLARVKEVIDWCYEDNLFVIINVHHEGWLNIRNLDKEYRKVGVELEAVWAQIAEYFADYDQHLIFEGMNEPRMAGSSVEWTGNKDAYQAINYLIQVFAQTIRANGKGHNNERCLMIPGYAASSSTNIMEAVSLPSYDGKPVGNIIASVHCYAPYNFCLQDSQMTFGNGDAASVEAIFRSIKSVFLDNGIPAVIGETSATEKGNTEERVKWAECMGKLSQSYGIPIVIWDNGSDSKKGGESHAYINRRTLEWNYPTVVKGLFDGFASEERGSALKDNGGDGGESTTITGDSIWKALGGATATKEWDSTYISMGAKATWFDADRSIAIVYTGTSEPKLILDSETKQQWWIPVEPTKRETLGDKKVIWYEYETLMSTLAEFGITDPTDLRNFMIVAVPAEGQALDLTTHEIVVTGAPRLTYIVNGMRYYFGTNTPDDPQLEDWVFLGWYTSKTYETKYEKGAAINSDATVYAMLRLKTDEERAAEITPTPEPTVEPTAAPTATADPTEAVEPTKAAEPTQAPERPADEHPSTTGWWIIVAAGLVAMVIVCAIVMKVVKAKKK